jgi:hypothetical protein
MKDNNSLVANATVAMQSVSQDERIPSLEVMRGLGARFFGHNFFV